MNVSGLLGTTALAAVTLTTAMLAGCTPGSVNILTGLRPGNGTAITLGVEKIFVLEGKGTCSSVDVDWGDGVVQKNFVPVTGRRIELETSAVETRYLKHRYTGWGGGKTITVVGNGCEGTVRARFQADPRTISIGWNARAPAGTMGVCQTTTAVPPLIPRMLVRINLTTIAGTSTSAARPSAAPTTPMARSGRSLARGFRFRVSSSIPLSSG